MSESASWDYILGVGCSLGVECVSGRGVGVSGYGLGVAVYSGLWDIQCYMSIFTTYPPTTPPITHIPAV